MIIMYCFSFVGCHVVIVLVSKCLTGGTDIKPKLFISRVKGLCCNSWPSPHWNLRCVCVCATGNVCINARESLQFRSKPLLLDFIRQDVVGRPQKDPYCSYPATNNISSIRSGIFWVRVIGFTVFWIHSVLQQRSKSPFDVRVFHCGITAISHNLSYI